MYYEWVGDVVCFIPEYLNIILMSVAQSYHAAKKQANLTSYMTGGKQSASTLHLHMMLSELNQSNSLSLLDS